MAPHTRVAVLSQHLAAATQGTDVVAQRWQAAVKEYSNSVRRMLTHGELPTMTMYELMILAEPATSKNQLKRLLSRAEADGSLAPLDLLPGPWRDAKSEREKLHLLHLDRTAFRQGLHLHLYAEYQARYGDAGLSSNIAVPTMRTHSYSVRKFDDPDEVPEGYPEKLKVGCRVIVADPQDAERVARRHLRKEPNFGMFMDSVISTTDNEHWRQQREHLVEAFLPLSSLAAIMPVSLSRAKRCAERLTELTRETDVVDMSDFLLHEAQAQLQLALLGAPESLMDATNSDLRKTFMLHPDAVSGRLSHAMSELYNLAQTDETLGLPSDDCPVKGPLARALQSGGQKASTDYGNMLIILFAGHDTTGHTMTWLMYELARRPELQRRVHAELDEFYGNLAGRDPIYQDLSKLVFLDRCITETLRLWPAVANGTFRQLQFEEQLTGLDGAQITLPRETLVQVANWSRHRNPQLWGDDAEHFNPDRNFRPEEVSHVGCPHAAMNPQSDRFSPFAHNPRSCLGKNFAGMEMRLILPELLRRFEFSLAPPYDHLVDHVVKTGSVDPDGFRGVNAGGTMGPLNLEALPGDRHGARHMIAMKLRVTPRHRSN